MGKFNRLNVKFESKKSLKLTILIKNKFFVINKILQGVKNAPDIDIYEGD